MPRSALIGGIIFVLLSLSLACTKEPERVPLKRDTEPEIRYIAPERPPKIELRFSKGRYSWVIRAEDPEKIIKVDRRLRQYVSGLADKKDKK